MRKIRTRGRQESGDYLPSPKQWGRSETKAEKQVSRSELRIGSMRYVARHRHGCSASQARAWAQMQLPSQRMGALDEVSPTSFPSSLTQNCKTALYQIGSWAQAIKVLGRAGEAIAKLTGVVQGPDVEFDVKKHLVRTNSAISVSIGGFLLRRGTGWLVWGSSKAHFLWCRL